MSIDDKIFWLVVTMPYIQNIICFIIGGILGVFAMALVNVTSDYQDSDINERDEDNGI